MFRASLDESKGKFACGDGEYNEIETDTDIVYKGKGSRVGIFAYVTADGERFPVRVLVTRNGAPERVCRGWSNSTVKCQTTISSTDRDRDDRDRDDRDRDDETTMTKTTMTKTTMTKTTMTRNRLFGGVSPLLDISDGAWGRERPMRPSVSLGRE